ncbi:MAG: response regulator [Clostridium sp.]
MAVAKGLIQMMGGEIHFSDEETGEAFCRIRLPSLIDEEQAQEKDAKVQEAVKRPVSIRGKKILLVEDNELNMEIAEFLLRKEGAQVIRAWNGKEALECFEASAPGDISVILMDLVMPVMDGFQSAKAIRSLEREDASKVAIIALTASDYEEDAQKCRQAGMDEHLPKPLDAGNLIRVIQKYLR